MACDFDIGGFALGKDYGGAAIDHHYIGTLWLSVEGYGVLFDDLGCGDSKVRGEVLYKVAAYPLFGGEQQVAVACSTPHGDATAIGTTLRTKFY